MKYGCVGYKTEIQQRTDEKDKIRIIVLTKNLHIQNTKTRKDLMTATFPSIWLEHKSRLEISDDASSIVNLGYHITDDYCNHR